MGGVAWLISRKACGCLVRVVVLLGGKEKEEEINKFIPLKMESAKRRRRLTNDTGRVHASQGIQRDMHSLIIRCGERGGLLSSRNGTSFASKQIWSDMGVVSRMRLGEPDTEYLLDAVATRLNVIQYRRSDTDPMRYAVSADEELRYIVPGMVEGNGIVYDELIPLLTLLAKRQQTINRSMANFTTDETPVFEGRAFVDLLQMHGSSLVQALAGSRFGVTVDHTAPCAAMHTQLAIAVVIYQAHDGRVFLAVDTGDTKTQGNIRYSIMVQQGAAPEVVVLYSGAGLTGETIELPSAGWYRYLDPNLVVGSVYVPFGRSVSLYTTGNSDPSGGVSLHLSSSVSDMGALTTNTARLVGEVRSEVVGTGTDAALVPQFAPLLLRPFPIDTNPLVPIHWFDASITGSMHREGVYTKDIAPGDPVNLWTYAGGQSSTCPAAAGAM